MRRGPRQFRHRITMGNELHNLCETFSKMQLGSKLKATFNGCSKRNVGLARVFQIRLSYVAKKKLMAEHRWSLSPASVFICRWSSMDVFLFEIHKLSSRGSCPLKYQLCGRFGRKTRFFSTENFFVRFEISTKIGFSISIVRRRFWMWKFQWDGGLVCFFK